MSGKYICVDGGDGAGKGTHIESLKKAWIGDDINPIVFTREPGGTPLAEKIRELLLSKEFGSKMHPNTKLGLFASARSDLFQNVIIPSIALGIPVVSDRDRASTFAYQVRADERPELHQLFYHLHSVFCQNIMPNLYVYLDVDPEIGAQRTTERGERNHFDEKDLEYKKVVREGYLEYFRDISSHSKTKVCIIDANRPLEVVGKEFVDVILEELKS